MGRYGNSMLDQMGILRDYESHRVSTWDRSGKNTDWYSLKPWEKKTFADIRGTGCIKRLYMIPWSLDPFAFRTTVLRMFWDDSGTPSVEVPLGDFFGIGNCAPAVFSSMLICVSPGSPDFGTYGVHSYFPMPFAKAARIEIENQSDLPFECIWFHADYELYPELPEEAGYFHAFWNRELREAKGDAKEHRTEYLWEGVNLTGEDNYRLLDIKGNGQLAGLMLYVDNLTGGWWGEGDDMIFIDDEEWPPVIHGTGTEEIFGGGACPTYAYTTPYCGFHYVENENWYRKQAMYRFYVNDAVRFRKSIHMSIEHGHANNMENDYSSVVYWYQQGVNQELEQLRPAPDRLPVFVPGEREVYDYERCFAGRLYEKLGTMQGTPQGANDEINWSLGAAKRDIYKAMREGRYDYALNEWKKLERKLLN